MVLQHGPFSLHIMLEGPWLHKTAFPTPTVRPLDESQESSPLQGHGSWLMCVAEPNIFLRICTYTQTITINNDLCPPVLFKLRPCIKKQCNLYYLPTSSLGWIGQIKGRSLSLASLQIFSSASVERSSLRNAHSSTHSVTSRQCHMATFYNT